MKLTLLFIVIDLLTLLAYPIVFVHGKLRLYAKSKKYPSGEYSSSRFSYTGQMTNSKM